VEGGREKQPPPPTGVNTWLGAHHTPPPPPARLPEQQSSSSVTQYENRFGLSARRPVKDGAVKNVYVSSLEPAAAQASPPPPTLHPRNTTRLTNADALERQAFRLRATRYAAKRRREQLVHGHGAVPPVAEAFPKVGFREWGGGGCRGLGHVPRPLLPGVGGALAAATSASRRLRGTTSLAGSS
jgi:hypothetical protein